MTGQEVREHVTGWRWDLLGPDGWIKPNAAVAILTGGQVLEPLGWFSEEVAVCLYCKARRTRQHHAPDPGCVCGLHAVECLSDVVADELARLARERGKERLPALVVSEVELHGVLPGAWPDPAEALAAGGAPDPPHTVRAHRKVYVRSFVDRGWLAMQGTRELPEVRWTYVRDLSKMVRRLAREQHS